MNSKIYFIPPYIPCNHCVVHLTISEVLDIIFSDKLCTTCKKELKLEDIGRYCGVIDNIKKQKETE